MERKTFRSGVVHPGQLKEIHGQDVKIVQATVVPSRYDKLHFSKELLKLTKNIKQRRKFFRYIG